MEFSTLLKLIAIADRVLPELLADWMNLKSAQNMNICGIQTLQVNMLLSWFIK